MRRVLLLLILSLTGCVDAYFPPGIKDSKSVLVIDGFININEVSQIKLSRSQNITDNKAAELELGASVWLEDNVGQIISLTEEGDGIYTLQPQAFTASSYRLYVKTKNGSEYVSGFEPIKASPPIDSVTWSIAPDKGIQVFVNTHDFDNPEGFYRWTFQETSAYTSAFNSTYIYNYGTRSVELRPNNIYQCWRIINSSDILVESTQRLSKNIIDHFPIRHVAQNSEMLRYKYSILVKQYSLTETAYNYWNQLKKNSEDLGSLFGPIPTQITGNFRSVTNPTEPVVGYFQIGSLSIKRIFISYEELPTPPSYNTPYAACEAQNLFLSEVANFSGPFLLISGIPNPNGPGIIGYTYSSQQCVDCRATGGTTTKPDFWE